MDPERWQQINDLFLAALEREPSERSAFIQEACDGDDELRKEIESLLVSHGKAGPFIEEPVIAEGAQLLASDHIRSLVGKQIGHYRILSPLGVGGMGEVYLANDTRLDRQIAVKILPSQFTAEADRVRRFQREARAASALNHPNILTIHEIGEYENSHFIATEFIEGVTLRQLMKSERIRLSDALDIAVQVASALAAAHAADIVHRDIKPENIMLRADGYIKVLDFGLAKLTEQPAMMSEPKASARATVLTDAGVVMGTASYMSPEQARGLPTDARTDIWSLGVVLYEMVAGGLPFEGATASDVIASILTTEPHPLSGMYSGEMPAELERIVTKALRKKTEERYQTVRDLQVDLRSLKQELEFQSKLGRALPQGMSAGGMIGSSGAGVAVETAKEQAVRPTMSARYLITEITRRKRSVIAALTMLVLAVTATVYFSYFSGRSQPVDSLAVLPFTYASNDPNVSGDPDREYLSDGISESLINSLSQLPDLRLIAHSSVLRYKGKEIDLQALRRELGVRAVITGRIIQRGDNLTISAELVDLKNNNHIWGEQYNRKLSDILTLQQEISRAISERLRPQLTGEEERRVTKRYTENAEALQLYLKGRYLLNRTEYYKAIEYFQRAIEKDPNYALAYSGLASCYGLIGGWFLPTRDALLKAEPAALKALEIDNSLAEAHTAYGLIKYKFYWDWVTAEREFKRAIDLSPNYAESYFYYSDLLSATGRFDEALALSKKSEELNPVSTLQSVHEGEILMWARRYEEAIKQLQKALDIAPESSWGHGVLANAYEAKGMRNEAIAEYQKQLRADGRSDLAADLGKTYATSGYNAAIRFLYETWNSISNEEVKKGKYVPVAYYVYNYAHLGEKEKVFEWLEKAYEQRDPSWLDLKRNPSFDSLRSDPRFTDLLRRAGLTL